MKQSVRSFRPVACGAPELATLEVEAVENLTRRRFLIGAGALVLAGCGGPQAAAPPAPSATTRRITHALGEADVPLNPQRIVTLDPYALETLASLNMQPVAAVALPIFQANYPDRADTMNSVQDVGIPPNLEAVAQVQPDLILGTTLLKDSHLLLQQIAPTVMFELQQSGQWKEVARSFADVLSKRPEIDQALAHYEQRALALKQALATRNPAPVVATMRSRQDGFWLDAPGFFPYTVLTDAGVQRFDALDSAIAGTKSALSLEQVSQIDADVIFVWQQEISAQNTQQVREKREELLQTPIWQTLKAVQTGNVHLVGSHWIGWGVLAAQAMLADLEQYLLK
ncbi:MAG: iron-siderophore ABC transporter substrate-binding protein [Chloroflexaceae bacterium]|jgi:iron complex transport system substrate-binding protein|nr:iron-siderophore ABC transporter substrate-binding protein [Chloroflexaceae bacterium]